MVNLIMNLLVACFTYSCLCIRNLVVSGVICSMICPFVFIVLTLCDLGNLPFCTRMVFRFRTANSLMGIRNVQNIFFETIIARPKFCPNFYVST